MKLMMLCLVLALAGCAEFYSVPPRPASFGGWTQPPGFDLVTKNLYRASKPDAADFKMMAELGITHDYQLCFNYEPGCGKDIVPSSIKVHYYPLSVLFATDTQVSAVLTDMLATCTGDTLCVVHCVHGQDRTGLVSALWELLHGTMIDDAYAHMMRHGFHPYRALWKIWCHYARWT